MGNELGRRFITVRPLKVEASVVAGYVLDPVNENTITLPDVHVIHYPHNRAELK